MTNIANLENRINAFITIAKIKRQLMETKLIWAAKQACIKDGRDYIDEDPYNEENWEE